MRIGARSGRWRNSVRCAVAAAAAVALASTAPAQGFHGVVRDSASRQPVPGAVFMLLDSGGVVLARRVTDDRGEYRIAAAANARWARVVRIGFKPVERRVPSDSSTWNAFNLSMAPVPTMLAAVKVRDQSRCPRRSDRAAALGLWEQARAGLLATVVSREDSTATVKLLGFQRVLEGNGDHVSSFTVEADSQARASRSFAAAHSARDFARSGFASDSAGNETLYGPDADVLLDDAFASVYCFRLASPERLRARQVGLAFSPVDHPKGRIDIDGTLWIDTSARTLKDIEYRYEGLPGATDWYRPGGQIWFRQMENGSVMIDRWFIRGVSAVQEYVLHGGVPRAEARIFATESGGELESATWPDGRGWHAALGSLRLHLVTSVGAPAAGTVVALRGTPYRGAADANGDVVLNDLLPGSYSAMMVDPTLERFGIAIPLPLRFDAVRDSTKVASLTAQTAAEWVSGMCIAARQWEVGDSVFVVGRVVTKDGRPVADAKVTFATLNDHNEWSDLSNFYTTGTDGVFQSCSAKYVVGGAMRLRVTRPEGEPVEAVVPIGEKLTVVRVTAAP